jgi:hypothetical protein
MSGENQNVEGVEDTDVDVAAELPESYHVEDDDVDMAADLPESYGFDGGDRGGRRSSRRGAVALAGLGLLSAAGAVALPEGRSILLTLAGIGLFGAVLLWYVTPGRFIDAAASESVYEAFATTGEEVVSELMLRDERIYAPAAADDESRTPVRLYVPARSDFAVPSPEELDTLFLDTGREGIAVTPSGGRLYREFRDAVRPEIAERPAPLAEQVTDALVNQFELVEEASAAVDDRDVDITITGSAYGLVDRFDHPAVSFSAVTLAATLDTTVRVDVTASDDGEYLLACGLDEPSTD